MLAILATSRPPSPTRRAEVNSATSYRACMQAVSRFEFQVSRHNLRSAILAFGLRFQLSSRPERPHDVATRAFCESAGAWSRDLLVLKARIEGSNQQISRSDP